MTLASLVLVIGAAGLHAGWNALAKRGRDPVVFLWCATLASTLALLPFGIWILARDGLSASALPFVIGTSMLHGLVLLRAGPCVRDRSLLARLPRRARPGGGPGADGGVPGLRRAPLGAGNGRGGSRGPRDREPARASGGHGPSWPGRAILWPVLTGLTIAAYSLPRQGGRGPAQPGGLHAVPRGRLRAARAPLLWIASRSRTPRARPHGARSRRRR